MIEWYKKYYRIIDYILLILFIFFLFLGIFSFVFVIFYFTLIVVSGVLFILKLKILNGVDN